MEGSALTIDTWLMSCRVIGRSAERFVFNALLQEARAAGVGKLTAEYVPTAKNKLVSGHYSDLGFTQVALREDGSADYSLEVEAAEPAQSFVEQSS